MRSIVKKHYNTESKESPNEKLSFIKMNTLKMSPMELIRHDKEHTHYRAIQSIFNKDISKIMPSLEKKIKARGIRYAISV